MPTITENKETWGTSYDWSHAGDEWSESWGSAAAQWKGSLFPRIFPFLGGRILEIAPGRGRWTQFLEPHCESLLGIDLAASCVEYCSKRFSGHPNLRFKANDGLTLAAADSRSVDFVFSFDSLVHAEADVLSSYVSEIARVLKPNGVAFLHHSNAGSIPAPLLLWNKVKRRIGIPAYHHWRARSMSADKMRLFVERSGMSIIQQELMPWVGGGLLIDCMSTIVNAPGRKGAVLKNYQFMQEADAIKRIAGYKASEVL